MLSSWRFLTPVSSSSSSSAAASPPPPPPNPSRTFLSAVSFRLSKAAAAHYSIRLREFHVDPRSESWSSEVAKSMEEPPPRPSPRKSPPPLDGRDDEDEGEISGIQVPRQRYVPVSKSQVLDAIVSTMFGSQEEKDQFLLMSSCLDSILHAEHKRILEEMRIDYPFDDPVKDCGTIDEGSSTSGENIADGGKESVSTRDHTVGIGSTERYGEETTDVSQTVSFNDGMDLRSPSILAKNVTTNSGSDSSRFQHAFMKLLHGARFEELSTRDLMLTSALNTDYLLTLPIYVDWNRASKSNAIIFRHLLHYMLYGVSTTSVILHSLHNKTWLYNGAAEGFANCRKAGLHTVENIAKNLFHHIKAIGEGWHLDNEVFEGAFQTQQLEVWKKRIKSWLQRVTFLEQAYSHNEQTINNAEEMNQFSDDELPIWFAAQRAVSRYEGLLPPVGPRGRLLRRLLMWVGLLPTTPETSFELDTISTATEPYSRPIFLPRISLSDIWKPARRKVFGNDVWKWLTTSISIFLSQSILQEPAFQELILLYTEEVSRRETENKAKGPLLRLKIYEKISIPDLLVVFPHKKLSFRIIDTIRLDIATLLGLLAFFVNYKFEDILLSPSAVLLDVIAITALVLYVSRVVLGYKQTWDRYQLLVNKTLYEKTLASGFGVVHFLLDASEQQQYKEAVLAYAILLKMEKSQDSCHQSVGDKCERFMYEIFKEKVEMPIERTVDTLKRLGLVIESETNRGNTRLQAIPCLEAYKALKHRWNSLLH